MKKRLLIAVAGVIYATTLLAQNPLILNSAIDAPLTGVVGINSNDNSWNVSTSISGPWTTPAVHCAQISGWNTPPSNAGWIVYPYTCTPGTPSDHGCNNPTPSDLYYRIDFPLSSTSYELELDLWADNCVREIYVNNTSTPAWVTSVILMNTYTGFKTANVTNFKNCSNWVVGNNYIIVRTVSYGAVNPDYTGLLVVAKTHTITGNTTVCAGSTNVYSVAPVAGATGYAWTFPPGWTGSSSTNVVSAVAGLGTGSGIVQVAITTTCGVITSTFAVTVTPGPIISTSDVTLCVNASTSTLITVTVPPTGGPYTFKWQPGGLTTQAITVSPLVNTNYVVTVISPAGCTSTANVAVTISTNCCSQPTTGLTALTNLNVSTAANTSYFLDSDITLGSSCSLLNSEVLIMPNVQIIVPLGYVLNLDHTHLYACGLQMWQGIVIQDGGQVTALSKSTSLIEDAKVAIDVDGTSAAALAAIPTPININKVIFNRNYIGIKISNSDPTITTYPIGMTECVFTSRQLPFSSPAPFTGSSWPDATTTTGLRFPYSPTATQGLIPPYQLSSYTPVNLKSPYTSQPGNVGIKIYNVGNQNTVLPGTGVDIGNIYPASASTFNLFDNIGLGFDVQDASLSTVDNVFQNLQRYQVGSSMFGGIGISHFITGLMNARLDLSSTTGSNDGNKFWDCYIGVQASNVYEINVQNGIFRSDRNVSTGFGPGSDGISIASNRFKYTISNSEFNNIDFNVWISARNGPYDIGGNVGNGTYADNMIINQNYMGPEVNSTNPLSATPEYCGRAITLLGGSGANWQMAGVCNIFSNKIDRAYRGIQIDRTDAYPIEVGGNSILIDDDNYALVGDQFGIYASNSLDSIVINQNTVTAQGPNNQAVKLIRCTDNVCTRPGGGHSPKLTLNEVSNAYIGFAFEGNQPNTLWECNNLYIPLNYGLSLEQSMSSGASGVIGPQGNPCMESGNEYRWTSTWNVPNFYTNCDTWSNPMASPLYVATFVPYTPVPMHAGGNPYVNGPSFITTFPLTCSPPAVNDCLYSTLYPTMPSQRTSQNITGISKKTGNSGGWDVDVFPNPSSGNITISSSSENEMLSVRIFDLTGKIVFSKTINNNTENTLDISALKASIYFIEIQNSDNKIVRKKLIRTL